MRKDSSKKVYKINGGTNVSNNTPAPLQYYLLFQVLFLACIEVEGFHLCQLNNLQQCIPDVDGDCVMDDQVSRKCVKCFCLLKCKSPTSNKLHSSITA